MIQVGPFVLDQYQQAAIDALRYEMECGRTHLLLVAPTGSGKTVIALGIESLCMERGTRVGFITSGRQLILQKAAKAEAAGLRFTVLMGDSGYEFDPDADLMIVSKDTLQQRWGHISWQEPDLWIVDEADVAISPKWMEILSRSRSVIGLTATPITGQGDTLPMYESLVTVATYSQLIESGRLVDVPAGCVFSPSRPDLTGGRTSAGDWSKPWLSERMRRPKLVGNIVEHWVKHGQNRPTVVFCVDQAHTAAVCDHFNGVGIPAAFIIDETHRFERDAIFRDTESGKNKIIVNCATLTRGWDLPCVSCCVLARPTRSRRLYLQMCGRVLRSHPSKSDAIVIDHAGAVWEHGWPTEDREWSSVPGQTVVETQDERRVRSADEMPERLCPQCTVLLAANYRRCPNCGFAKTQKGQQAETADGNLVTVKRRKPGRPAEKTAAQRKQQAWMGILYSFGRSGRQYSNAHSAFKRRFGVYPEHAGVGPTTSGSNWRVRIDELFPWIRRK